MSFGKSVRGKKAPPPLPMYQPVVLKHVPTMVRRRYEHFDVDKLSDPNHDLNHDGPTNDGESEEDEDLEPNDEDELEDMGPGYISSEHGSALEEDNCDRSGMEHSVCNEDTYVKAETQDYGLENPSNDQALPESEDTDLQDSNPCSEVDCGVSVEFQHSGKGNFTDNFDVGAYSGSVSNGSIQPTELESEYSGSEDDGSEVAYHAPIVGSNLEDETQDKILAQFSNEQGDCKGEDNGAVKTASASYHSLEDETLGTTDGNSMNGQDSHSENNEIQDDGNTVTNDAPIVDSNLDEDEIQDKRLTDFSVEQGDITSEDDGAGEAKTASYACLKDEAGDMTVGNSVNEHGLLLDGNNGGYDEADGGNPSFSANASVISKAEEMGHGSSNDKQETLTQLQNDDLGSENLIRTRSLHLKGLKIKGNGTDTMNGNIDCDSTIKVELQGEAHRTSNNEEDFDPEAFTKTVEDDGYELCCPYCKHCITNTLIYHRRGNSQHGRTTCFTGLLGLFCCIRD